MESTISFLNLGSLQNVSYRKRKIEKNTLSLRRAIYKGNSVHAALTFGNEDSAILGKANRMCMDLAVNNITGEVFIVLSEKEGIKLQWHSPKKDLLSCSRLKIIETISKVIGVRGKEYKKIIKISENLSNESEKIVYKVLSIDDAE